MALHYWPDPLSSEIPPTCVEFLHNLQGPTHIHLRGRNRERCRAVMTLLHGNEPSGLAGAHAVLRQGVDPCVDTHIFIASVEAARALPLFHHRMLPGQRDLNRCFRPPFPDDAQGHLAQALYEKLHEIRPEALIDVHNTSGAGPAFGVATHMDEKHEALVSLFSHRLVVTDLPLGAVMELSDTLCPTVTIECGGAREAASDQVAMIGLAQYLTLDNLFDIRPQDVVMEFFHHPQRLELQPGAAIGHGTTVPPEMGINMLPDVERLNFTYVEPLTLIGHLNGELDEILRTEGRDGYSRAGHFFLSDEGLLRARVRMKFFMVTNNPEIARSDCLLYFVPA